MTHVGEMMDFLDTYTIKARLFPALLAIIPALVLFLLAGSWQDAGLPEMLLGVGIGVLFFALSDIARRAGKRAQRRIFRKSGGTPVNLELSHSDATISPATKERYLSFLSAEIGSPAPTPESEHSDPAAAARFYLASFDYLRNSTTDHDRFRILFNENINYGFRRNLYGLKPVGIALNLAAVAAAYALFRYQPAMAPITQEKLIIQGGLAALHAGYFLLFVTESSVLDASKIYARQLVQSCQALMNEARGGTK